MNKFNELLKKSFTNDKIRKLLIFKTINFILFLVCFIMSIVNLFTKEWTMLYLTSIFSILCIINFLLSSEKREFFDIIFCIEATFLLTTFVISGKPEGFAALWTLMIPALTISTFGRKKGTIFSLILLLIIILLFWTGLKDIVLVKKPDGSYPYTDTFMLRFPFVYICLFIISYYVEFIRMSTYKKLQETENNFKWLYKHDNLTGIYNRHAFYEEMKNNFGYDSEKETSIIMLDVDNFKTINDIHGHNSGDAILRKLVSIIDNATCDHSTSCRWGGEEFLIMMKCDHNPEIIAEKIRSECENSTVECNEEKNIKFTISVGISKGIIKDEKQMAEYINIADKAMYVSKIKGKNQITLRTKL